MADIVEEYRTAALGAVWIEQADHGRIRFEGPDRASFLQALLSNDIVRISRGQGVYATYLTPQGRMIADIEVLHRGEHLLGVVADGCGPALAARFDQLVFSENVQITDVSATLTEIAVTGGRAADAVATALALDSAGLASLPELSQIDFDGGFVVRDGASPWPMFRVVVPTAQRSAVLDALDARGVQPMTGTLSETIRVEAGRPVWGKELTPEIIPLEAGLLERGISTSKGCYVGQEIIIRILHRGGGRVAKRLMKLTFDANTDAVPAAGSSLLVDDRVVGHITSAAYSPSRERVIALAYVHRDSTEIGTTLTLAGGGAATIEG